MNIFVCIKQVPDTNLTLKANADGTGIREEGVEYVTSPYDDHAIEAALQLKEKHGGVVTVLTLGPESAEKVLKDALARGCDEAMQIQDPAFEGSDCIATAKALSQALNKKSFDLVLCGKQAADDDSAAVGQAVAEYLNIGHVTEVEKIDTSDDGSTFTLHRATDDGVEIIEGKTPLLLTCQKALNKPRYASLKGKMKAKKVKTEFFTLADLGIEAGRTGKEGSPTKVSMLISAPEKQVTPKTISGEPAEQAKELARLLNEEAKVI
jgi:electron transfer flavoprotein beta subunit